MDLTESIVPRSDQINADELISGPATYTVREVIEGKAESPFDFLLVETDRAYRPSKTMRRVIVNAWGAEAANYAGRRLTLYREPTIKFGGAVVGGIRISHMSHIDGRVEVLAQVTRGKREKFVVEPLTEPTTAERIAALQAEWRRSNGDRRKAIEAEVKALQPKIDSVAAVADARRPADHAPYDPHPFAGTEASCDECGQGADAEIHRP